MAIVLGPTRCCGSGELGVRGLVLNTPLQAKAKSASEPRLSVASDDVVI